MIIFINIYIYIMDVLDCGDCGDFGWYQTLADALSRVSRPV